MSTTTSIDTRTPKIDIFLNPTPTRFKIPLESRQLSLQKCQIAFVVVPLVPLHDTTIRNTPSAQHAPIECQQQRSNKTPHTQIFLRCRTSIFLFITSADCLFWYKLVAGTPKKHRGASDVQVGQNPSEFSWLPYILISQLIQFKMVNTYTLTSSFAVPSANCKLNMYTNCMFPSLVDDDA